MSKNQVNFQDETGEILSLSIIERTKINEFEYILVADDEDRAYIMKVCASDDDTDTYEFVEDETELSAVSKLFAEMLDDISLE